MTQVEELHQRYVEAWNRHDPAAVVARFGPEGQYESLPMEHTFQGEELQAFVRMVMTVRVQHRMSDQYRTAVR